MILPDQDNSSFKLAADFINHTSRSIFLTGKAGTGKTTLLKYIGANTSKRFVVVAPTGVAAINAGGVTIHSFFGIPPFGAFVPDDNHRFTSGNIMDKNRLLSHMRYNSEKREMLLDLELLIIDEVSMVRCDLLDAIDFLLRTVRKKKHLAFGGVQVVYFGDLYQLPPVVKNEDWHILREYYKSPFFFDSNVLSGFPPLYIELKKVYRQEEERFIQLLNRVRNNEMEDSDFELLHERFEGAASRAGDDFITLTTHNYKADAINQTELKNLPGSIFRFSGKVEGEFPDHVLPAEMELQLKIGAQVMFVRNDTGEGSRRYYNGRIASVSNVTQDGIWVKFPDTGQEMKLDKETWRNTRYAYNREEEKVMEESLGSYTQYPVRLAWAITVHKSQGLTFNKAVVDLGDSFAPGQVYVALSRCTSLKGLILRTRISAGSISTDPHVLAFATNEMKEDILVQHLRQETNHFVAEQLVALFDFEKLRMAADEHVAFLPGKKVPDERQAMQLARQVQSKVAELDGVAEKFRFQLSSLLEMAGDDRSAFLERIRKAIPYFSKEMREGLLYPVNLHLTDSGRKTKKYKQQLRLLKALITRKLENLGRASYDGQHLSDGVGFAPAAEESADAEEEASPGKREKGSSQKETLALHREGLTVSQIAERRQLARTTIEGHLAYFIRMGEVEVSTVVSDDKLPRILESLEQNKGLGLGVVKEKLGEDFSYAEIRAVVKHLEFLSKNKKE